MNYSEARNWINSDEKLSILQTLLVRLYKFVKKESRDSLFDLILKREVSTLTALSSFL